MKPSFPLLALALLSCSQPSNPFPDLKVDQPWARATLPGKPTSAAYFSVTNSGGADDALVGVTASNGIAELHSMSMDGGIMRMRKLERLPIAAGTTVNLEPGGNHVMLTDLDRPLAAGEQIELKLRFATSAEQTITAQVRDLSGGHE